VDTLDDERLDKVVNDVKTARNSAMKNLRYTTDAKLAKEIYPYL